MVAERDHNPARPQRLRRFVGKKSHTPPRRACLSGRKVSSLPQEGRLFSVSRLEKGGGVIPPGAAPVDEQSRMVNQPAKGKRVARPCGLGASMRHHPRKGADWGESFPLVSVYEKRAESDLRETKGKKTDWDMGRGKKRP